MEIRFCLSILLSLMVATASANVVLTGNNITLSFDDIEANFAPLVKGNGICGILHLVEPLDACSPLTSKLDPVEGVSSPFALIVRGGCNFEEKVRRAQTAGFKAAIVYDSEDNDALVSMAGNSAGIKIHAVFVSNASGEILKRYAGLANMEVWIIPSFENSAWSIIAISFISLLAMSAVLATCFFVRRHRIRREQPRAPYVREVHGMSSRLVKAMPSLIFTAVLEDNCTSQTCAICLEDYIVGDKLRILPCRHKFHAACVDSWLTAWRTFCPVCKRDARTSRDDPPASESTPLLSSGRGSASSSALSSMRSSLASSSAIRIAPASSRSPSVSRPHSLSSTPHVLQSFRSYCNSPAISLSRSSAIQINPASSLLPSVSRPHSLSSTPYVPQAFRSYSNSPAISLSRSSLDSWNASSQRSYAANLIPPHSLGYPTPSPHNSRFMSPYIPSSSNASPSYVGSSSRQTYLRHCSESAASLSPFASAQSLPGC